MARRAGSDGAISPVKSKDRTARVAVTPQEWRSFRAECVDAGLDINDVLATLIRDWMTGRKRGTRLRTGA